MHRATLTIRISGKKKQEVQAVVEALEFVIDRTDFQNTDELSVSMSSDITFQFESLADLVSKFSQGEKE